MNFEFATAGRILFGEGRVREVGEVAATLGSRALLVQGRSGRATDLIPHAASVRIPGEPTVAAVEEGVALARTAGCDLVISCGGGSVIDAGKAIAALLTNPGSVRDYLEVIGSARPLTHPPVPSIAVPTTAGTGSEVTRNSVLASPPDRVKVSLRSPLLLPAVAVIDPELTYSQPPEVTASTGMDALAQCIEPFVSVAANPLSDAFAREGMRCAAGALRLALRNDPEARRDMAVASLCGGLALANARLGAVHGIAAPLGGMYPVAHGVAVANLLAPVMATNIRALRARDPGSEALVRYAEVAEILTGRPGAHPEDGAHWVRALVAELPIAPLAIADVAAVVELSRRASSMKGNPIELTADELAGTL